MSANLITLITSLLTLLLRRITKEVDKDSKEAKKFLKESDTNASSSSSSGIGVNKRPGGIASIMNVISGKKQKMGCLDKSKLDWNNFVKEEGIKEELETHNKGKDGSVCLYLC